MFGRHSATLTALLMLGAASLAHAQQATGDTTHGASTHAARVRSRDEGIITRDTTRLHQETALRDSTRATLERDQAETHAVGSRIDSVKGVLARERKASPRDTTAINRNLAELTRLRQQLDRNLDRDRRLHARVDSLDTRVRRQSEAAIDAHQGMHQEIRKSPAPKTHG